MAGLPPGPVLTACTAAYYGDTLVGSMCCRVEREKGKRPQLYIMTLGVLAAYRRLGIGKSAQPLAH